MWCVFFRVGKSWCFPTSCARKCWQRAILTEPLISTHLGAVMAFDAQDVSNLGLFGWFKKTEWLVTRLNWLVTCHSCHLCHTVWDETCFNLGVSWILLGTVTWWLRCKNHQQQIAEWTPLCIACGGACLPLAFKLLESCWLVCIGKMSSTPWKSGWNFYSSHLKNEGNPGILMIGI